MTYSLRLNTSRLVIVGINEIQLPQLVGYFQRNQTHLKRSGGTIPETEADIRTVYQTWLTLIHNDSEVRFFLIQDQEIIGIIGISNIVRGAFQAAYLGYNIDEAHQGKGYMTEALEEIIFFAFSALNLHRLMANYRPENLASARVLEKLGFVKEGFAKNYLRINGNWADHILTSKTNTHWVTP